MHEESRYLYDKNRQKNNIRFVCDVSYIIPIVENNSAFSISPGKPIVRQTDAVTQNVIFTGNAFI
jgi:hypothetical protein